MPSSPETRSSAKRLEMRVELDGPTGIGFRESLKIRAGGSKCPCPCRRGLKIQDYEVIFLQLRETLDKAGDGVGGFERRNDAFSSREEARCIQGSLIGDGEIFGAALVGEPGVLGADGGIVEPSGNRMRRGDLAVFVLQNVSVSPLQHARARSGKTLMRGQARGVFTEFTAAATSLDADHFHIFVAEKLMKEADGIRAAADASEQMCGQALFCREDWLAAFAANHC